VPSIPRVKAPTANLRVPTLSSPVSAALHCIESCPSRTNACAARRYFRSLTQYVSITRRPPELIQIERLLCQTVVPYRLSRPPLFYWSNSVTNISLSNTILLVCFASFIHFFLISIVMLCFIVMFETQTKLVVQFAFSILTHTSYRRSLRECSTAIFIVVYHLTVCCMDCLCNPVLNACIQVILTVCLYLSFCLFFCE